MTAIPRVEYFVARKSLSGVDSECGDIGVVIDGDCECFLGLFDALGHGKEAAEVSNLSRAFVEDNYRLPLVELMNGLHKYLKSTRGSVAAMCRLDKSSGALSYVGIGNINVRIFGVTSHVFLPRDGIIGYTISTPKEQHKSLFPGDILLMTSDGIKEHYSLHDYPQLLSGSAQQIVQRVIGWLGKNNDDSSCVVLRYGV